MSLVGSQHKERYEQMKQEVNRREIEWWFYRSNSKPISSDLKTIIEMIKNEFLTVGPFGSYFVKENVSNFKPSFYGIPMQHAFVYDSISEFEGIASVAPCGDSSILLKNVFDYFRSGSNLFDFSDLDLTAICVQSAANNQGQRMVVAVDCIEKLKPMAFYEHPPNGRVLMAMENMDPPEQSALTFYGKRRPAIVSLMEVYAEASRLYNERELGNIEDTELSAELYSFFEI